MVATPFRRSSPKSRTDRPMRFVLGHLEGPAPVEDVSLIEAVPGLTIAARTDNLLLVSGPTNLKALKDALPSLRKRWTFANETFYHLQGS